MTNNTTEFPSAHELRNHLYVSPAIDWQHEGYLKLTPERIDAIEYLVIEKRAVGMDTKWFVELMIDGKQYWDIPGSYQINQIEDWISITNRFPVHVAMTNEGNGIWAACKGWQL